MKNKWWEKTRVYQIYPKSFKDTNHDGIGDIKGIVHSLDYIASLGVETLWLNPIFMSPQVDNGYDVSDYYTIDPKFGTMEDVEHLIAEAHKRELKIIFDLVLNHTSTQHPWFQEALKGKDNPYRQYYHWEAPKEGKRPNNWGSFFGGSVWEYEPSSQEYYFHLFDKEMPDLNWTNPRVRKEMAEIAIFWLGKGIDGFRLDAFIHMEKASFDEPVPHIHPEEIAIAESFYANRPEVLLYLRELIREMKRVKPDVFILGEAASATPELGATYIGEELCSAVVSFRQFNEEIIDHLEDVPEPLKMRQLAVQSTQEELGHWQDKLSPDKLPTLYWNNHDMPRLISRFGNKEMREESGKALATAMYLLKGIPVIYNGEEIGMKNLLIDSVTTFQQPEAPAYLKELKEKGFSESEALIRIASINKEAGRGTMQWSNEEYGGFSDVPSWIGTNREAIYNVDEMEKNKNSLLAHYKQLMSLKQTDLFVYGKVQWLHTGSESFSYKRVYQDKEALVIVNLSNTPMDWPETIEDWQNTKVLMMGIRTTLGKPIPGFGYLVLKK